jgi:hypothetical protein
MRDDVSLLSAFSQAVDSRAVSVAYTLPGKASRAPRRLRMSHLLRSLR